MAGRNVSEMTYFVGLDNNFLLNSIFLLHLSLKTMHAYTYLCSIAFIVFACKMFWTYLAVLGMKLSYYCIVIFMEISVMVQSLKLWY